jgi:uncharacterized DUF497 family protein
MEFEWDASKEADNLRKHRVSFTEAVESFFDPHGLLLVDEKHSRAEERFYWVGKCSSGRVLWREFRRQYSEKAKNQ